MKGKKGRYFFPTLSSYIVHFQVKISLNGTVVKKNFIFLKCSRIRLFIGLLYRQWSICFVLFIRPEVGGTQRKWYIVISGCLYTKTSSPSTNLKWLFLWHDIFIKWLVWRNGIIVKYFQCILVFKEEWVSIVIARIYSMNNG